MRVLRGRSQPRRLSSIHDYQSTLVIDLLMTTHLLTSINMHCIVVTFKLPQKKKKSYTVKAFCSIQAVVVNCALAQFSLTLNSSCCERE